MEARQVLTAGTVLNDQYRIERVLGVGGFGITYAAVDTALDLQVAIKEYFPAEFGARDASLSVRPVSSQHEAVFQHCLRSFEREAQTLAQFRHPSIVRVLRVFAAHGTAYMVMEFERGQSLSEWLDGLGRRPTQAEIDRIVEPLLAALETLHAASFIHRDVAPDNILMREVGTPVLIDFGAARQVVAEASRNLTGIVKQGFSPPEQYALDKKLQGPWTDIYALGAILYLMVVGRKPQPAPERQLGIEMATAVDAAEPGYRASFLAGIDKALAIQPSDRPQTLAALKQVLFDGRTNDASPASRPGTARRSVFNIPGLEQPEPEVRGFRYGFAGPLVAGLLLLAFVGWQTVEIMTRGPDASVSTLELDRRRAEAEKQAAEQRQAAERAEAERQRMDEENRALAEKRAAEERRRAAERAEADRQRIEAEKRALAEKQAKDERRLVVADIRRELNRLGCRAESTTPDWTDADQRALQLFVEHSAERISIPALNRNVLTILGRFRARVCPLECRPGESVVDGKCQRAPAVTAPSAAVQCQQINERAQLGILTEEDREMLRRLNCR